jgi:hypothetical protein
MNELFSIVLLSLAGALFFSAYCAVLAVFFPRRVGRAARAAGQRHFRALLLGLINLAFFSVAFLVVQWLLGLVSAGLAQLAALAFLALLAAALSVGLAGLALRTGAALWPQAPSGLQAGGGAAALALAAALPVVGWFGLLPYTCCLGAGAFIISFFTPLDGE